MPHINQPIRYIYYDSNVVGFISLYIFLEDCGEIVPLVSGITFKSAGLAQYIQPTIIVIRTLQP